jgi:predicted nucleotidyltransferase
MALMPTNIAQGPPVTRGEIQAFVDGLVNRFRPLKVILFGSYAYGDPNSDSDVDLLVIMPRRGAGPKIAARMILACPNRFPVDLLVRSPMEIRRRAALDDTFMHEVTTKGIVLHEADYARMGR